MLIPSDRFALNNDRYRANTANNPMAYDDKEFIDGLEWLWGKGFLSPGGPQSIADIMRDTDIRGQSVLDFGCGIGGIDQLLVTTYGAAQVTGLDVVESLIERARLDAANSGLSERIEYQLAQPGGLQFDEFSFDVIFTKDTVIHIPDKLEIYQEFYRVLRPQGVLVGSDWLGSDGTDDSDLVKEWLDFSKLDFHFCTATELRKYLQTVGFTCVETQDQNEWYRHAVREEISRVSGKNRREFVRRFGEQQADARLTSSTLKMNVVDAGHLRPTIFSARKL